MMIWKMMIACILGRVDPMDFHYLICKKNQPEPKPLSAVVSKVNNHMAAMPPAADFAENPSSLWFSLLFNLITSRKWQVQVTTELNLSSFQPLSSGFLSKQTF